MREYLFRGQTRKYGEKVRMGDGQKLPGRWVYGGVLQGKSSHSIIYGGENVNDPAEGFDKWVVHTDTLGQYTGLTDKVGKKIFEGDILEIVMPLHGRKPIKERTAVYFDSGCFYVKWGSRIGTHIDSFAMNTVTFEVIGNIHDNPELLKEVSDR